jgi:anti-sigma regulatory factor (Ser/Thr protein kinase)
MRHRVLIESPDAAEAAARAIQWADGAFRVAQAPEPTRLALHLALDEIVTNVARYAYDEGQPRRIALSVAREPGAVRVVVSDTGRPFNPLHHVYTPEDTPLDQRRVGGLGIFLVRQVVDEVRYRRRDGRNVLTLVKRT